MTREPSSAGHRYLQALGRSGGLDPTPPPTPKPKAKKARKFRIVVEPAKPQRRSHHADERANLQRREQALTKLTTTTEALTSEERKIISGYRLSSGGEAAEAERRRIERETR